MIKKFFKFAIPALLLIFVIFLYNTHTISTWRHHNNGVKKFKENKFDEATTQFQKALTFSDDVALSYNWAISSWMSITKQYNTLVKISDSTQFLETAEFDTLKTKISKFQIELDSLLQRKDLPDDLTTTILYVKGKLFLQEGKLDNAQDYFKQALVKNKNFRPALLEVVKLESINDADKTASPETQLLINLTDIENVGIVENYKPF